MGRGTAMTTWMCEGCAFAALTDAELTEARGYLAALLPPPDSTSSAPPWQYQAQPWQVAALTEVNRHLDERTITSRRAMPRSPDEPGNG